MTRILALKFKLGLFDYHFVDPARPTRQSPPAAGAQAAKQSITLLHRQDATCRSRPTLARSWLPASAGCVATDASKDPACQAAIANQLGSWSVSWRQAPTESCHPTTTATAASAHPTDPDRHHHAGRHQGGGTSRWS